jgi:hypothetical protein
MVFARDDVTKLLLFFVFKYKNVFIRYVKMRVFVKCRLVQIPKTKAILNKSAKG